MNPVAPWISRQTSQLLAQRGHAWLLQGPSGLGQYALALELVRAWLCDQPATSGACGRCPSCHAVEVHAHTDLCLLMPETVMQELGWPLTEKAQAEIDDKKRKPSKEIRVDALRDSIEFAQRTSGRGRGKAVLVYPAERMNLIAGHALLKTLEEPAGDLKFVLATEAAHLLLPTVRSRCQSHNLSWPEPGQALDWLQGQGLSQDEAAAQLRAAGGRPDDALQRHRQGWGPKAWALLPQAMARGDVSALTDFSPAEAVNSLQKLCHDLLVLRSGSSPRFYPLADLPPVPSLAALCDWSRQLARSARTVEHPLNAGLMLEALVSQARTALNSRHSPPAFPRSHL